MSIFKAREWWSRSGTGGAEAGACGAGSAAVERLGAHPDGDCVLVGEGAALRLYRPDGAYRPQQLVIEAQLEDHILQVDTGIFVAVADDVQVIVLHPLKYSVYMLQRKEGHTDIGDQNTLVPIITHTFNIKAYRLVHGNFGNTKSRELVCVQSLDGTFYVFDQEAALFVCSLPNIVIPGPFQYIKSCDSFVIHKSNWILEIYSYQQMTDIGNTEQRTNKKLLPQWIYNAGEEIYSLQVIQTSNNFSSIVALGERHLYCLQDNGLLKYMKKFDYMPVCFHAYLIGWYYEPNSRLLTMVASDESKLLIYESTTLLWSCELSFTPIAISRCFLKGLPGGIFALSEEGVVSCCYLGTEPDLSGSMPSLQSNDSADPRTVQDELDGVEATLKSLTENEDNDDDFRIEDIVSVAIVANNTLRELDKDNVTNELHRLVWPVAVEMMFKEPHPIRQVQVTFFCSPPFAISEAVKCLDGVQAHETVEVQIFMSREIDVSDFHVKVLVTFTDDVERIRTVTLDAPLPVRLLYIPSQMTGEMKHKITINSNLLAVDLTNLFSEYTKEEWTKEEVTHNTITFIYRATNTAVSISCSGQSYSIRSDHYSQMTAITEYLVLKLKQHHKNEGKQVALSWNGNFNLEMLQSFMKCIESHASARLKWQQHEEELTTLQSQFTLIQKKLLVQYGALPPGECDALEFLLKDTYGRISTAVQLIIESRSAAFRAGGALISVGCLLISMLELMKADRTKTEMLREALCLCSLYEDQQDWEETVSQSVSHLLSTMFGKSEKDKEKLAPVTEQGILNPINLKRFMKQIKILIDRMFADLKEDRHGGEIRKKSHPERVEELVEDL